jgi:PIN domain nuclease of toxin-antitoxin system
MKLLIDTQVFIWLINDDPRLGKKSLHILSDPDNQLNLSYFSIFEMTIKASIGKLDYDPTILDDLPKMGIALILPDEQSLKNYTILSPDNKDPFDNALIAVARNGHYSFITSDPKILALSVVGLELLNSLN